MIRKKGFSFAEMVMALTIMSFLAYILFPMLKSVKPNTELAMFRKAYYNAERIVQEMINDDNLYPIPLAGDNFYFANTEDVDYNGRSYAGNEKFARLFAAKLDANGTITCSSTNCTFTSPDGIVWTLPKTNFQSPGGGSETISVDVNGSKKPNCAYGGGNSCTEPDRFSIKVYPRGVIAPNGCMEQEYLIRQNTRRNAQIETFDPSNPVITFDDNSAHKVTQQTINNYRKERLQLAGFRSSSVNDTSQ